jgi:ribonuclease VapC
MVVDSSVIVAIIVEEEERELFEDLILRTPTVVMSVVSLVECSIVLVGKRTKYDRVRLDDTISTLRIDVCSVDLHQGALARTAFAQFGRGSGTAQLNFGDCFAYALAKAREDTLLFKGEDFLKTDIVPAWRP